VSAILFVLVLIGLIALPFVPLVVELLTSNDVAPLAIDEDLPIDASRLTSCTRGMVYAQRIDADHADFNGVVAASDFRVHSACRFRHLYGMPIMFGKPGTPPGEHAADELCSVSMPHLLAGVRHRAGSSRYLVFGNLSLPAHALVEADLIVNGSLHIGNASLVRGNIKATSIDVGVGATVRGALFARREARLRPDCLVDGVLSVDGRCGSTTAGSGEPTMPSAYAHPRSTFEEEPVFSGKWWRRAPAGSREPPRRRPRPATVFLMPLRVRALVRVR